MRELTRDTIQSMPYGLETDGWVLLLIGWAWTGSHWIDNDGNSRPSGFSPSTSIASAKVVQGIWLAAHPDYAVSIESVNTAEGISYDVIFWGMDGDVVYHGTANTEELAICRALLMELVK